MAKGKVGIVGLGIMGGAFARNLLAAGWRVVGYDIDAARRRAMARAGVEIADDAKALAGEVGTIVTSLPKPAALAAHELGACGNGSRMKYVAKLLGASNNVASADSMELGLKTGLDAQTVFD